MAMNEVFSDYRISHPLRRPKKMIQGREAVQINEADGLKILVELADTNEVKSFWGDSIVEDWPLACGNNDDSTEPEEPLPRPEKNIWVVRKEDFALVLEQKCDHNGHVSSTIQGEPILNEPRPWLSHTNLTGGEEAYCGGEMWAVRCVSGEVELVLNGCSGRYPPFHKLLVESGAAYHHEEPDLLDKLLKLYPDTGSHELESVANRLSMAGFRVVYVNFDAEKGTWRRLIRPCDLVRIGQ
ncbi:MAG: hypothetical protein H7834_14095 [Magnetococcus sp. YQC-9]